MTRALSLALLAAIAVPASAQTPAADAWEDVLEARLSAPNAATGLTRFDYGGFVADPEDRAALDSYIAELSAMPEPEDDADAAAYWANLYNAVTIDVVADNFPVDSIRDIKPNLFSIGPWKMKTVTVRGKALSLDNIEHDILRVRYSSPLVHYMVNCASVGCPNLLPALWDGATLDADRERAARAFVNSPRGVRLDGGKVEVSSIYKWFDEDFGGTRASVMDHIRAYADDTLAARLQGVRTYDSHAYDWTLNGREDTP